MTYRAYYTIDGKMLEREVKADCTHDALTSLPHEIVASLDSLFIVHENGKLERV